MGLLTEADREGLEMLARESAAQRDPSHVVIVSLRGYCLEHGIDASDGELFVIAEDAIAQLLKSASSPAEHDQPGLLPRSLRDRRERERRHGPRRIVGRRRTGLLALVEDFLQLGRSERRSDSDRRSVGDRRSVIRRTRVRRRDNR